MLDYLQLYPETIEQVKRYSEAQRCRLYEAMAKYAFTGEEPSWPDDAPEWFIWETLRQQVNRTMKKVKQNRENASANTQPERNEAKSSESKPPKAKASQPERNEAKSSESKPTKAKASQPERNEAKSSETNNQESKTEKENKNNNKQCVRTCEDDSLCLTDEDVQASLARDEQIEDAAKSAGLNVSEMNMVKAREYARVYGMDKLLDAIAKTAHGAERITWAYVEGVLKGNGVKPNDNHRDHGTDSAGTRRGKYSFLFDGTEAV